MHCLMLVSDHPLAKARMGGEGLQTWGFWGEAWMISNTFPS